MRGSLRAVPSILECIWLVPPAFAGLDQKLYERHPLLYFLAVGLKYGPARSRLTEAAVEAGLSDGDMAAVRLKATLVGTVARLHNLPMLEWERPQL